MRIIFKFLIVSLIFVLPVSLEANEPIFRIVFMDKENPPRILGDGTFIDSNKPGISVELIEMVAERVGIKFTFERMPWKRCLAMVEYGSADATFHASYKENRAVYGIYPTHNGMLDSTRAIYINRYVLYTLKGSNVNWDGKTLHNVTQAIGAQLSYAVVTDLTKMGHKVEEVSSIDKNLNKLLSGRISAYAEIETIADSKITKNIEKYSNIQKLKPPLREKDYYLLISKKFAKVYPELCTQIFDAIHDVKETDAYKKMLIKYE